MPTSDAVSIFSQEAAAHVDIRMAQSHYQVPTSIGGIDRHFRYWGDGKGIPRGEYVIVGGKSGAGKTRFSLHLLRQAIKAGENAEIVSMEMRKEDLFAQALMGVSRIEYKDWLPSNWTERHGDQLVAEANEFSKKLTADATAVSLQEKPTLDSVMDALESAKSRGVTFILLDHLQLVKIPRMNNIIDRVEEVSETVREWAVANTITVVGLSQLKRTAAEDYTRSPTISDLWGGTSMESNAGLILLLDHSRLERDQSKPYMVRTWFILGKNRLGADGIEVPVEINYASLRYREMMQDEEWNYARRPKDRS